MAQYDLISDMRIGQAVFIHEIEAVGPDGSIRNINGIIFTIGEDPAKKFEKIYMSISDNNNTDRMDAGQFFQQLAANSDDENISIINYKKAIKLYESIHDTSFINRVFIQNVNSNLFICYNNMALDLLYANEYSKALEFAKKGADISPTDTIIYTKLALAYLFTGQYKKCKNLLTEHKNSNINDILFKDYILSKLDQFEEKGITHSDFEKVRKLLNENP